MSQGLLQCLGVSHVSIAAVSQITAAFKLQSKLTGAGGGGCVLTLYQNLSFSVVPDAKGTVMVDCC